MINPLTMDFYITPEVPQTETTTNPQLPPPPPPLKNRKSKSAPPEEMASYKECLKNHAASIGGHALDGCGEFMPSPTATATDPTSLTCAACDCHRNFHRRVAGDPSPPLNALPLRVSSTSAPHMLLALRSGGSSGALDWNGDRTAAERKTKRVRTRFSEEQKEKMYGVSEKLGWRLCKGDEGLVEDFCSEIGIGKDVLKVWMHNNKHTFPGKRNHVADANGYNHLLAGNKYSAAHFQDGTSSSS